MEDFFFYFEFGAQSSIILHNMRRLTEISLPFPGFDPTLVMPEMIPPEITLPRPEIMNGHDTAWRNVPGATAPHIAKVIRPIIQPNPQSGNKRGKRL
jgi:hypothetical protein